MNIAILGWFVLGSRAIHAAVMPGTKTMTLSCFGGRSGWPRLEHHSCGTRFRRHSRSTQFGRYRLGIPEELRHKGIRLDKSPHGSEHLWFRRSWAWGPGVLTPMLWILGISTGLITNGGIIAFFTTPVPWFTDVSKPPYAANCECVCEVNDEWEKYRYCYGGSNSKDKRIY